MRTSARRTPEPYFWLLFSAGGMVAALTLPILVLLFGVLVPLGVVHVDPTHLEAVVRNPVSRIVLAGIFVLALFHAAHRFRFTVEHGLQLGRFDAVIAVCCYGAAALGSLAALWIVLTT
jgi:fumarate reductase subunit D